MSDVKCERCGRLRSKSAGCPDKCKEQCCDWRHGESIDCADIKARESMKPDRRDGERQTIGRRLDDKTRAALADRMRYYASRPTFIDCRGIGPVGKVTR